MATSEVTAPSATSFTRLSYSYTVPAGSSRQYGFIKYETQAHYGNPADIIVTAFQVEDGTTPTSYIPTTTSPATRAADQLSFTIPSGIAALTYTFDDNSTQVITGLSSGSYTVPTNLNRPHIKTIVGGS